MTKFWWLIGLAAFYGQQLTAQVRVEPLAAMRSVLTLPDYRADDRSTLCQQSLLVMDELFVHRELKVQDFGANHDPVPRLQGLCSQSDRLANADFHRAISDIYIDLHDLHTNYVGARPLACGVAFIPLKLSDATLPSGEHQILVSRKLNTGADYVTDIEVGMRLQSVDGEPVEQVIERLGHVSGGANSSAMRHRAIQMLSMRGASTYPLPGRDETELVFTSADGARIEKTIPWLAQASTACLDNSQDVGPFSGLANRAAMTLGVDSFQQDFNAIFGTDTMVAASRPRRAVTNPSVVEPFQDRFNRVFTEAQPPRGDAVSDAIATVFEHSTIRTPAGLLGYIKLKSFYWESQELDIGTVTEAFRRTLEENFQSTTGLVVDVRGNPGGFIIFAEKLIQLFAAQGVEPTTVRMLANELNHSIFIAANGADNRWSAALRDAINRNKKYMEPMAITPASEANAIGQVWFKPVVVLTDAGCYSACDLFAAGMQDNNAGTILGLNQHTGAGGANVMEYGTFRQILGESADNPFAELPFGHNIRVSWRQTIRAGKNAGELLENRGIISDRIIPLTPQDVLEGESRDLMRNIHAVIDTMAPNYVAGVVPLRGGLVYTQNDAAGSWRERVWGVDRLEVWRGADLLERIDLPRTVEPTATEIRLNDLVHSWRDERVTIVGMRDSKQVLRIVRDVKWRGDYLAIPARGLTVDFADGESDIVRTMQLAGPTNGGWQVVNGALRVGAGTNYESRVLTRAVTSLVLANRGAQVSLDIELAAESQSDVLRIYAENPDTKAREEVFSGSSLRRARNATFKLPTGWQRADLVFEFESDENWNMAGPMIRMLKVSQ